MYTKKDIRDILDPESDYYYYCGKWGINGVVHYGENGGGFALFVNVGRDIHYNGRFQTITADGRLNWSTPLRKGTKTYMIRKLLNADKIGLGVSLFCRRKNDYNSSTEKLFTYIGKGSDPEVLDDRNLPEMVIWTIKELDAENDAIKRLID